MGPSSVLFLLLAMLLGLAAAFDERAFKFGVVFALALIAFGVKI